MVNQQQFKTPFKEKSIRALKPKAAPYRLSEPAARGEGRLIVRVLPNGTKEFFYRYRAKGQDKTLALGRYDQTGNNGKTLAEVRKEAAKVRRLQRETGDVKEHKRAEERRQEIEARRGSLQQLLEAYVQSLRDAGRLSADQVNGIFKLHVIKPFPSLVAAKASDVNPEDVQRILARMVKAGITRQVNKVRSYLSAAFAYGGKADHDPRTVAHDGVLFALKANPVTLVPVIKEYERTGDRTLSEDELREYWKALKPWPAVQRAALRLNLALACQRPTQLLRAEWADFDFGENSLLLRDSKGRGGSRDHLLPLTAFALEQLKPLRELNRDDAPPFANDGKRAMVVETLSVVVRKISKALKREKEIPRFQLRDLRRTAETMLQKMGVDREVRAHLLSHGRSAGVQGKHYERYDFLKEKRAALEKWADHIQRIIEPSRKAKVIHIGKRRGKSA